MFNGEGASAVFDLVVNGVSLPQLTQQRAQIFVQIKYIYCQWFAHPRIVYRIVWIPWSLFFFVLSLFSAELGEGHICHHGNLYSVNLLGPGSDYYLLSWDSVSPMEPEYCTIFIGGGFISSCHSKPSSSFEFTLIHFGCEPSAVLLSPGLRSSTSVSFQFSQSTLFLERDFFEIGTLSLE